MRHNLYGKQARRCSDTLLCNCGQKNLPRNACSFINWEAISLGVTEDPLQRNNPEIYTYTSREIWVSVSRQSATHVIDHLIKSCNLESAKRYGLRSCFGVETTWYFTGGVLRRGRAGKPCHSMKPFLPPPFILFQTVFRRAKANGEA